MGENRKVFEDDKEDNDESFGDEGNEDSCDDEGYDKATSKKENETRKIGASEKTANQPPKCSLTGDKLLNEIFGRSDASPLANSATQLAEIIEHMKTHRLIELDIRYSFVIHRRAPAYYMGPETGGVPFSIGGYCGAFKEYTDEEWISNEFGGGVYDIQVSGPKSPNEAGSRVKFSIRGISIGGEPKPSRRDKSFRSAQGTEILLKYESRMRELNAALEGGEASSSKSILGIDPDADQGDAKDGKPSEVDKTDEKPSAQDVILKRLLDKSLRDADEERQRNRQLEQEARKALLEAAKTNSGLDTSTVHKLLSEMRQGNLAAIENFSEAVADGNQRNAEALNSVLQLLQAERNRPVDDGEIKRLNEQLLQAQASLSKAQEAIHSAIQNERQIHQAELSRIFEAHRAEVKELRDQQAVAIDKALEEARRNQESHKQSHELTIARLERQIEDHKREIKDAEARAEARIQNLQDNHATLVATLKSNADVREKTLADECTRLKDKIEELRAKEIDLRDAKQSEALGKTKAEIERDNAKRDAERLDLDKVTQAMTAGKTIAEAIGYEKPDANAPSMVAQIGSAIAGVADKIVSNERFGNLVGALASGLSARSAAPPLLPNPAAPPASGVQRYEDMVAEMHNQRAREQTASALEQALALDLPKVPKSEPAPPPKVKKPTPTPQLEPSVEEEERKEKIKLVNVLVSQLEELASAGASTDDVIDRLSQLFEASRDEIVLYVSGLSGGLPEVLAGFGFDIEELSGPARRLLEKTVEVIK